MARTKEDIKWYIDQKQEQLRNIDDVHQGRIKEIGNRIRELEMELRGPRAIETMGRLAAQGTLKSSAEDLYYKLRNPIVEDIERLEEELEALPEVMFPKLIEQKKSAKTEEDFCALAKEFRALGNYENSVVLSEECAKRADEIRFNSLKNRKYSARTEEEFRTLVKEFRTFGDYEDAVILAERCEEQADEIKFKNLSSRKRIARTEEEFRTLAKEFRAMKSYQNAVALADECSNTAQQILNEKEREYTLLLEDKKEAEKDPNTINANVFRNLATRFSKLEKYKNASVLSDECNRIAEKPRKYDNALDDLKELDNRQGRTADDFRNMIKEYKNFLNEFSSFKTYNDSYNLSKHCEEKIEIYKEKFEKATKTEARKEKRKTGIKNFWLAVLAIVLGGIIGGGLFAFLAWVGNEANEDNANILVGVSFVLGIIGFILGWFLTEGFWKGLLIGIIVYIVFAIIAALLGLISFIIAIGIGIIVGIIVGVLLARPPAKEIIIVIGLLLAILTGGYFMFKGYFTENKKYNAVALVEQEEVVYVAEVETKSKSKVETSQQSESVQPQVQQTQNTNSHIEIEMVFVQGGTFQMGQEEVAFPVHQVTLSSYYIGKYAVTQEQWVAVMGNNPSVFQNGDNYPVENVSWDEVQIFISNLNAQTGKKYRLPTEAEWEYAARGGNQSQGYIYSGSNNIDDVAWYRENSNESTHPVGVKAPNELGLYDMSGNVWEWCSDWLGKYPSTEVSNPKGASKGSRRIYRGCGWGMDASYCRVFYRSSNTPDFRKQSVGFRLALSN